MASAGGGGPGAGAAGKPGAAQAQVALTAGAVHVGSYKRHNAAGKLVDVQSYTQRRDLASPSLTLPKGTKASARAALDENAAPQRSAKTPPAKAVVPPTPTDWKPKMLSARIWPAEDARPSEIQGVDMRDFRDSYLPSIFGEPSLVTSAAHQVFNPVQHGGQKKTGDHIEGPAVFQNYATSGMPRANLGTEPIKHVYRAMSAAEWAQAERDGFIGSDQRGVIADWEGTNAGANPATAMSYLPRNGGAVIVQIAVKPEDKWFTTDVDDYLRTREKVPLDRIIARTGMITSREGQITDVGELAPRQRMPLTPDPATRASWTPLETRLLTQRSVWQTPANEHLLTEGIKRNLEPAPVLYRGLPAAFNQSIKVGSRITLPTSSFSDDFEVARQFAWGENNDAETTTLLMLDGALAAHTASISNMPWEGEWLTPPGTYEVTKIDSDPENEIDHVIHLRPVHQDEQ